MYNLLTIILVRELNVLGLLCPPVAHEQSGNFYVSSVFGSKSIVIKYTTSASLVVEEQPEVLDVFDLIRSLYDKLIVFSGFKIVAGGVYVRLLPLRHSFFCRLLRW